MRTVEIPWPKQPGGLRLRLARVTHLPVVPSRSTEAARLPGGAPGLAAAV